MAVTLTGTGGIWTRLGKLFQAIRSADRYQGDTAITSASPDLDALGTSYTEVLAQYASADQQVLDSWASLRDGARSSLQGWKSSLAQLCQDTLIAQVDRDVTLTEKTVEAALKELIYQMVGAGALAAETADNDIDASTVSISCAAAATIVGANTGNAVLVGSVKRHDSRQNQLVFAETMEVFCDSDSQQSTSNARSESWTFKGEVAQSDPLDYRWPDGSGASGSLTTVDSDQNNGGGNLLYNSSWDAFTVTDVPDYWGIIVGAASTDILSEASTIYRSSGKSLRFKGTGGSPLSSVVQPFAVTTPATATPGTSGTLKPNTVYLFNAQARKSASAAAGVIEFSLVDGSNVQVTDDSGTDIKTTAAVGALSSSAWTAVNGTFVTPKVLPTTVKMRVRVSTAITSGESIYIDDLALTEATQVYTGGPYLAIFAGSTNPIVGDKYTAVVANNLAGDLMLFTDRVFGMRELGLQFPSDSASTETIVDTLIG